MRYISQFSLLLNCSFIHKDVDSSRSSVRCLGVTRYTWTSAYLTSGSYKAANAGPTQSGLSDQEFGGRSSPIDAISPYKSACFLVKTPNLSSTLTAVD